MSQMACAFTGIHGEKVALKDVSISAFLRDLLAEVTVSQTYRNEEQTNIEAVYTFPLPLDAVLLELDIVIGNRRWKGAVVEKRAAEKRYEDAVESGDAAVMLEELEPGMYTMNVGNLLPGEDATITFRYSLLYRWTGDNLRLLLPTTIASRYGDSPHLPHQAPESSLFAENRFSLQIEVFGILQSAQFSSPTHSLGLTHSAEKTTLFLKQERSPMDRDFVLNIKAPKAERSFVMTGRDGSGCAALASFQPFFPGLRRHRPLTLALVIDCSGSMHGDSIAQARRALEGILDTLDPSDRFTIITFGSTTQTLWEAPSTCTPVNREAAKRLAKDIDANMGGTEIGGALARAYRVLESVGTGEILLVTDGEVSSWQQVVKQAKGSGHRVFTVGVGNAVSESFVRQLAGETRGECELVAPREDMAERIIRHFERIRSPRAKRVNVHWPKGAQEVAPSTIRAVFEGDTVLSFARFDGTIGQGVVVLEAEMETGEKLHEELPIPSTSLSAQSEEISTVARLAAQARLKESTAEAALPTALKYRLLTQWTNWIAVVERPAGEKAVDIPALRKTAQMPAPGIVMNSMMESRVLFSLDTPDLSPFSRRIDSSLLRSGPETSPMRIHLHDQLSSLMPIQVNDQLVDALILLSTSGLSHMIEFLALLLESDWILLSDWAVQEGHSGIVYDANEFLQLLRTKGVSNLNTEQARNGLIVLRCAVSRGFKVRKELADEARRKGTVSRSST
jgi:Ca-activated chloride channel family protein